MPELPEVETSRRGITPHIQGKTIESVIVRNPALRWPIPDHLVATLPGLAVERIKRRAKYLLFATGRGTLIMHLGMSGNLRITQPAQPIGKHDHFDLTMQDGTILRLNDPRRFGAVLWTSADPASHPLLAGLGPEPLSDDFDGARLLSKAHGKTLPIKSLIMDGRIVVGVGNIYANEALFLAGIHPTQAAGKLTATQCQSLANAIKDVLQRAIEQGGTTLRDFVDARGKPGYFQQALLVYGRVGQPCLNCNRPIELIKIGQRASYFCNHCQPL